MSTQTYGPYGAEVPDEQKNTPGKFRVRLASCGNPDHGQNPNHRMYGAEANRWQKVGSIAEASTACRKFIEDNDLGGGNWSGGEVMDDKKIIIARISYNGRAWLPPSVASPESA